MPQINFYVPEGTAARLRRKARQEGLSLSRYVAMVVTRAEPETGWPRGYFENVIGAWEGELQRPRQLELGERDPF